MGKFLRTLRRDHLHKTINTAVSLTVLAGMGITALATGGAAVPVYMLIIPGFMLPMGFLMGVGEDSVRASNSEYMNGYQLVGERSDIGKVKRVQDMISQWTGDMKHLEALPPVLERKILNFIADLQPTLSQVRVLKDGEQVFYSDFCFIRYFVGRNGTTQTQKIPCVPQSHAQMANIRQVAEGLPAPKVIQALPAPVTPEFTHIAQKVESLEDRLQAIENPKPADLGKALFKKEL